MWGRSKSQTGEESTNTQGSSARRLMWGGSSRSDPEESKPLKKKKHVSVEEPLREEEDEDDWATQHYPPKPAKHRRPDPEDEGSQSSGRTGRSGRSASSRGSSKSKGSDLTGISEDLPWRPGSESDWGDFKSDGVASVRTRESDDDHEDEKIALLQSSQPAQVGTIKGRYVLRVVRASLKQAFGITFDVNESRGSTAALMVSGDLPHLGIRKGDELLTVNSFEIRSINEVRQHLQTSLSIVLVMQRRGVNARVPPPKYKVATDALEPLDRVLLSATQVRITDIKRGEFKLSLQRSSHKQKFGLAFEAAQSKKNQELSILVSEDMPHLALERNDKVHIINGIRPRNRKICAQILNSAMTVNITFRRDPKRIRNLVHVTHPVADVEEDPAAGPPVKKTCCPLFDWCCGPNWAGSNPPPEDGPDNFEPIDGFEDMDDHRSENAYGMRQHVAPSSTFDAMGGTMEVDAEDPCDCCYKTRSRGRPRRAQN